MIVGIDEVGRGAWAGPVVVASAVIDDALGKQLGLNDSKLLSKKRRDMLAPLIRQHALWIGIGWVSAKAIDAIGMSAALKLAAERSVAAMPSIYSEIIIDGTIRLLERPGVTTLKKADQLIPSVMAASIIAKVARDTYMEQLASLFPGYGFEKHVGYGTALHQQGLTAYGVSNVHRKSFAPMKAMTGTAEAMTEYSEPKKPGAVAIGTVAETVAAEWLVAHDFTILLRNWKTKRCEIDIIAEYAGTVYCVEVKYRRNARAGTGFDYITPKKQQQMLFAAHAWQHMSGWHGALQLAAIELTESPPMVTTFVKDILAD